LLRESGGTGYRNAWSSAVEKAAGTRETEPRERGGMERNSRAEDENNRGQPVKEGIKIGRIRHDCSHTCGRLINNGKGTEKGRPS